MHSKLIIQKPKVTMQSSQFWQSVWQASCFAAHLPLQTLAGQVITRVEACIIILRWRASSGFSWSVWQKLALANF